MCSHVFMYQDRDPLQRHRHRWQCGTCGRLSSVPCDCCSRPAVVRQHTAGLPYLLRQWLSRGARWTRASVQRVWEWQRHPTIRADTSHAPTSPHNMIATEVSIPFNEGAERDDVLVAAGTRQ